MFEYLNINLYLMSEVETVQNICKMLDLKCEVKEVKEVLTCYNVVVKGNKAKYVNDFQKVIALMFKMQNEF